MKLKDSSLFVIFLLVLSGFSIIHSLTFRYRDAKLVPLLASAVLLAMMGIELLREIRSQRKPAPEETNRGAEDKNGFEWLRLMTLIGWMGGFLVSIYVLGFIISIALFVFAFLKGQGRSWLQSAIFAVSVVGFIYLIFVVAIELKLPKGLFFS